MDFSVLLKGLANSYILNIVIYRLSFESQMGALIHPWQRTIDVA